MSQASEIADSFRPQHFLISSLFYLAVLMLTINKKSNNSDEHPLNRPVRVCAVPNEVRSRERHQYNVLDTDKVWSV